MTEFRKNERKKTGGVLIDWNKMISMLSAESQTLVRDYLENMVNPQAMQLDDFFNSSDMIIKCETSYYNVPKVRMITLKAINNFIICDDKDSFSVITPSSMVQFKNYKNP
jgi:hypothetical protein